MNILPYPTKCEVSKYGKFVITQDTKVFICQQFGTDASLFVSLVSNCGVELQLVDDVAQANIVFAYDEKLAPNSYVITVGQGGTAVSCSDNQGCYYAVQTLRQMFNLDLLPQQICCEYCHIFDKPKFSYRSLMIDSCRHMLPLEQIKSVIDLMSMEKLNVLHWHLTDDQGFRVEIEKYPLINKVASFRNGTEVYQDGKRVVKDGVYGGYYTKQQIREIVSYAQSKYIEIVPEVDLPGHMVAVLSAYPQYSCTGQVTETYKKWGISKDILCAGNDDVYPFICDILDEIADLFPSKYFHLGGDEAPKDRWCNCKLCSQKLTQLQLNNYDQLQTYMVEQFRTHLQQKGKTVICWNDGCPSDCDKSIVSQAWFPKSKSTGIAQTNKGRKTIISTYENFYFDLPYAKVDMKGLCKYNCYKGVKRRARSNVLGVEGTMWSEWIAEPNKFFFNLLPRMDALAEVAWGNNRKGNVKNRIKGRFAFYKINNIVYNSKAFAKTSQKKKKMYINEFYSANANKEFDDLTK